MQTKTAPHPALTAFALSRRRPMARAGRVAAVTAVCGGLLFACDSAVVSGRPGSSEEPQPGRDGGVSSMDGGSGDIDGSAPTPGSSRPKKTEPKPLSAGDGLYPRAILRSNGTIVASVVRFLPSNRMGAVFFESTDGGLSFDEVGVLDDPGNGTGLCCGTLFELPRALGAIPAGTLLWAASRGADADGPMSIPVWRSDDGGRNWAYVSSVVTAAVPRKQGGLWEPEFSMTDDGALVCHWSDETDPGHSQKLVKARSFDGLSWSGHSDSVALGPHASRPGMPNVRRPPGGDFFLSYEICGLPNDHCTAFFRTSTDGWSWGDSAAMGIRPTTPDGEHFRHAPTLAWTDAPGANGRFIMVGQMTHAANGAVSGNNGRILLANTEHGHGFWYPIAAPVPVPAAYDNFCPNYSSTVVPLESGSVALEIASQWDGTTCRAYFARSPLVDTSDGTEISDGASFRIVSLIGGHCLDVESGSTAAGGNVQQASCNGTSAQRWTVSRGGDGTVSLRAAVSNMCLGVAAGATKPGANVEQAACGSGGQSWKLRGMGLGYYELVSGSGVCLDVANGSAASGANVQIWSCNDLAPQLWRFDKL